MPLDAEISEANRAASARVRAIAERCSDEDLQTPVGEHWTMVVVFAHLAFWDRRAIGIIDQVECEGRLEEQVVHHVANEYSLPLWLAIPAREAARIAIETVEAADARIAAASDETRAAMDAVNPLDPAPPPPQRAPRRGRGGAPGLDGFSRRWDHEGPSRLGQAVESGEGFADRHAVFVSFGLRGGRDRLDQVTGEGAVDLQGAFGLEVLRVGLGEVLDPDVHVGRHRVGVRVDLDDRHHVGVRGRVAVEGVQPRLLRLDDLGTERREVRFERLALARA